MSERKDVLLTPRSLDGDHADQAEDLRAAMYRVLILNDDYTPMEFVVYFLEQFFN